MTGQPSTAKRPHGSETFFVGELPPAVAALPYEQAAAMNVRSPEMRPSIDQCREEFDNYAGVSRAGEAVRPTNLSWAFYIPSAERWADSARWIRCDAVTRPLDGQPERSTSESLKGILTKNPLPASLRACYREAAPPPDNALESSTSCDQPHEGESLLRYRVTDPKIDALGGDQDALADYVSGTAPNTCTEGVAAHLGLSTSALRQRGDVRVVASTLNFDRWFSDPQARQIECTAVTERPVTGTIEGLGSGPLPSGSPAQSGPSPAGAA